MAGVGIALAPRSLQAARLRLRKFASNPFTLGVASGYPTDDGMVLWTRIAPNADAAQELADVDFILTYEIATDPNFSRRVQSGTVIAMALISQEQRAGFPLTHELESPRLPKRSWVKIGQIRTLSTERIGRKLGSVAPEELAHLVEGLNEIIGS